MRPTDTRRPPCATDPEQWFSADPRVQARARAVCATCPLRAPCLEAGHQADADAGYYGTRGSVANLGIWGGHTPRERRWLRAGKRVAVRSFTMAEARAAAAAYQRGLRDPATLDGRRAYERAQAAVRRQRQLLEEAG